MLRSTFAALSALTIVLVGTYLLHASTVDTTYLPYQGYLERDGAPQSDTCEMQFELYKGDGTTQLWSETQSGVVVAAGRFAVNLGAGTTTAGNLSNAIRDAGGELLLKISVKGSADSALVPLLGLQRLAAAPFAHRSAPGTPFVIDDSVSIGQAATIGGSLGVSGTASFAGKATFTRSSAGECCGNDATIALAETTNATGLRASISFHNGGVDEGRIELAGSGARRLVLTDGQGVGVGLEASGAITGPGGRADCGTPTLEKQNCRNYANVAIQACDIRLCNACGCSAWGAGGNQVLFQTTGY